jgi:hypothetical protein
MMDFIGKAIYYFGSIAVLAGIIALIFPLFGLRRTDGLLAIVLGAVFIFLGPELSSPLKAQLATEAAAKTQNEQIAAAERATLNAARPVKLTKEQMLANLRIDGFSWEKEGFDSVMVATFIVNNSNPLPVKDIEVTCGLSANSGTTIDVNKRTIYESIDKKSYLSVREMNMGFINSQAKRSKCIVTDFKLTG